jgi:hypothetical protein
MLHIAEEQVHCKLDCWHEGITLEVKVRDKLILFLVTELQLSQMNAIKLEPNLDTTLVFCSIPKVLFRADI